MEGVQSQSSLQSEHDIVVMFSQRLPLVIIQGVLVVVLLLERDTVTKAALIKEGI